MRLALDDQISAQADMVAALLDQVVPALDDRRPVVFTGIGVEVRHDRIGALR